MSVFAKLRNGLPGHPNENKPIWTFIWKRKNSKSWKSTPTHGTRDYVIEQAAIWFGRQLDLTGKSIEVRLAEVDDPNVWGEANLRYGESPDAIPQSPDEVP